MQTIRDRKGKEHVLSSEVYEIVSLQNPVGLRRYTNGAKVRLISGVYESSIPGYHFSKGYVTVCSVEAKVAEFVGVKKEEIKLIREKAQIWKIIKAIITGKRK